MSRWSDPKRAFWKRLLPIAIAILSAAVAIAGGVLAFRKAWIDAQVGEPFLITAIVGVVLLLIVAKEALLVVRGFEETKRQRRFDEEHEVRAACQTLREQIASWYFADIEQLPEERRATAIRVCVYRVVPSQGKSRSPELERVTRYCVGEGGDAGEAGKRISTACGVVGRAYRTAKPQMAYRDAESIEGFRQQMIEEWSFDPEDAKSLNETRWSFLAFPISYEQRVDAILFIDSELRNCFSEDADGPVQLLVAPMIEAIQLVIERRTSYAS
jgi:hypothetical protein